MATATKTNNKKTASKIIPKKMPGKSASAASVTLSSKQSSKTKKMGNSEFHNFFMDELKDIYWAEKHLVKALPKMQKASTSSQLATAFEKHIQDTRAHITTLEQVFELLNEKVQAKKCDAMEGLVEEAKKIIEDTSSGTLIRDAGLILAAQKVEHYEIATYGTLRTFAQNMGQNDIVKLLQQTLDNEKATDVALTKVAESFVNEQAASE